MHSLRTFCLLACLVATVPAGLCEYPANAASNSLKPCVWLTSTQLQTLPSLNELNWEQLENLPAEEGAKLLQKIYHLSQLSSNSAPSFVPSASNIPVYIFKQNGQKIQTNLNSFAATAKLQPNFGDYEVTILITGLPETSKATAKAIKKLVKAYMQRYNGQQKMQQLKINKDYDAVRTSSEEDFNEADQFTKSSSGDLVIIDLGAMLTNFKRFVMMDTEQTGALIGKAIVELTNQADVPHEIIHIVAQGVGAHVAGAAARQYKRFTGQQLRRISALDPTKLFANNRNILAGLARGDAELVDVIHTSAYGMGTPERLGDVDFFPNGPAGIVPGADNVIEASMRATRYFAESVRPGNERNFPAFVAKSLQQYKENNGHGKRAFMGIDTDFDIEGDYMLEVNAESPFGKFMPAQK